MIEIKELPRIVRRDKNSHKGSFGKVIVIAGSRGMMGAACLTTKAALRSGSGLVTLATSSSEIQIAATKLTCAMTYPLMCTEYGTIEIGASQQIISFSEGCDAVVLGPGLSQQPQTQDFVKDVILKIQYPLVIDADGLNALVGCLELLKERPSATIITPHPGEFSRLTGASIDEIAKNGKAIAEKFATDYGVIVVLKLAPSIVVSSEHYYINTTGNPGMATGGSGDILSGIIASLLGQKFSPFQAAQLAVSIHGYAGDLACEEIGEIGMIATDILDALPYAFKKYQVIENLQE